MKILIVDDEPLARERLAALVEEMDGHESVGQASHGRQAVELAHLSAPDVVLMDIRMPSMDGIEAARHLTEMEQPPAVIFCTAYDDQALAAFDVDAIDYLVKPIRRERLERALDKANRLQNLPETITEGKARTHLCARTRGNLELVPIENVLFLMAEHKYVTVAHTDGEVLIEEPLKQLEEEFAADFVRIHRNALVSRNRLAGLEKDRDGHSLVRIQGTDRKLEVSRRNLPGVRRLLKQL